MSAFLFLMLMVVIYLVKYVDTSINLSDCSNNSNASSTTSVPFTNELNDVESYLESCVDRETSQVNTDSG